MRSRPKVKVLLSPAVVVPGQRLTAEAVMLATSETPIDWMSMELRCNFFTATGMGKSRVVHSEVLYDRVWSEDKEQVLTPGEHRRRVAFDIPVNRPASYVGSDAGVHWTLLFHVSIPWWPDRRATFDIPVGHPASAAVVATPGAFATSAEGPRGTNPFMEVSLDSTQLAIGDVLSGSFSVTNLRGRRVRGIDVSFVEMESITLPRSEIREARRFKLRIFEGQPPENEPIPFKVRVPDRASPSFVSGPLRVGTHFELRADISWGDDIVVRPPLLILPRTTGPRVGNAWVAPIGRERRALVWANVASRAGLQFDPENDCVRGAHGPATVEIRNEQRAEDSWLVANIGWPSLGIDLLVAERKWSDALSSDRVKTGDEFIDERLAAHAREHVQAKQVVTPALLGTLMSFEEVTVTDRGATVAVRGSAHTTEKIDPFIGRVLAAARAFVTAGTAVPPPLLFQNDVPAWRALADRLRGDLELGRMWIRNATVGTDRVELGCSWATGGALLGAHVHVPIDPPLAAPPASPDDPSISPAARDLWKELAAKARNLTITTTAVDVDIPDHLHDPQTAVPLVETAVALRRALAGITGHGPFR